MFLGEFHVVRVYFGRLNVVYWTGHRITDQMLYYEYTINASAMSQISGLSVYPLEYSSLVSWLSTDNITAKIVMQNSSISISVVVQIPSAALLMSWMISEEYR